MNISNQTARQIAAYKAAGWEIQTRRPSGRRADTHDAVRIRSTRYARSQRFASETWAVRPSATAVPFTSVGGQTLPPEQAQWHAPAVQEAVRRCVANLRRVVSFAGTYRASEAVQHAALAREFGLETEATAVEVAAVAARIAGGLA